MRVWLAALAAAIVVVGEFAADGSDLPTAVIDALAGASFLAVGVVAAGTSRRCAVLAALAGVAWFAGGVSEPALWVHRPLMVHCALAHPTGRLPGPLARTVVVASWVAALVPPAARSPGVSLVLAAGVALAGWRLTGGARLGRRGVARTAARAAGVLAASLAGPSVGRLLWPGAATGPILDLYAGLVAVAGLILLGGLLLQQGGRETDIVIELTEDNPEQTLAALRREVAARDDPVARGPLAAAIDLLQSNVALQSDLAENVDEVRVSRRRLVETAVVERRRLEQQLADGAVRYLDELTSILGTLQGAADEQVRELAGRSLEEVSRTRADLDQLARGLHPRVLAEHGLAAALADLSERFPVPTTVRVPEVRFPMIVESTVWYGCAEAMANVAKYAHARSGAVEVWVEGHDLKACIRDDGVGGARCLPGGGLAGLADRLSAVGGELVVASPRDGGTRVLIRVPLR